VVDVHSAAVSFSALPAKLATNPVAQKHPEPKAFAGLAPVLGFDVRLQPCDARTRAALTCRLWSARTGRAGRGTFRWAGAIGKPGRILFRIVRRIAIGFRVGALHEGLQFFSPSTIAMDAGTLANATISAPAREALPNRAEMARRLTVDKFDSLSRIKSTAVRERFGSWSEATGRAGLAHALPNYSDTAIIEDLRRVSESSPNEPLTNAFYSTQGRCSVSCVKRRFGGWREALVVAGIGSRFGGPFTSVFPETPSRRECPRPARGRRFPARW
jgi:hypothetical protein